MLTTINLDFIVGQLWQLYLISTCITNYYGWVGRFLGVWYHNNIETMVLIYFPTYSMGLENLQKEKPEENIKKDIDWRIQFGIIYEKQSYIA